MKRFMPRLMTAVVALTLTTSVFAMDFNRILYTFDRETGDALRARGTATFKNLEGTDGVSLPYQTQSNGYTFLSFSIETSTAVLRHHITAQSRKGLCQGYVEGYSVGTSSVVINVPLDCARLEPSPLDPPEPIIP